MEPYPRITRRAKRSLDCGAQRVRVVPLGGLTVEAVVDRRNERLDLHEVRARLDFDLDRDRFVVIAERAAQPRIGCVGRKDRHLKQVRSGVDRDGQCARRTDFNGVAVEMVVVGGPIIRGVAREQIGDDVLSERDGCRAGGRVVGLEAARSNGAWGTAPR